MKDGRNEIAIKRLNLAKRYLENAKEELKKSSIDGKNGIYEDVKYVSSACGKAYLSALEALKSIFLVKIFKDEDELKKALKSNEGYSNYISKLNIGKDRDNIMKLYNEVYKILHLGGYYRELQDKKAIDSGFEKAQKIIKIVKSYVDLKL
jgi:HEPN domain-containing protein